MNTTKKILPMVLLALIIITANVPKIQAQAATANCGLIPSVIATQITNNEPWYCPINQQIYSQWIQVLPYAIVVVLIAFLIAAAIFMVGVALNSNKIRNFGIGEFYEALATAIIVGAFLYVCAVIFGVLPATLVGSINPYATTFSLMSTTINSAQQMYGSLFRVYLSLSFITSPKVDLSVGGVIGGIAKKVLSWIGFAPQLLVNIYTVPVTVFFLDPALVLSRFLSDGISILYAEYYLMIFFAVGAIPAFLIPGTFFRAIFPTRALGGFLIALAIGFYLIMPTLFAVVYYFTAPTVQSSIQSATTQINQLSGAPPSQIASPTSPLVVELNSAKASLNGFWLLILFYPAIIIAITYSAITEISKFIGSASALAGGRMGSGLRRFI